MIFQFDHQLYITSLKYLINLIVLFIFYMVIVQKWNLISKNPCLFSNNYLLMEASRPLTDCKLCLNVSQAMILNSLSQRQFENLAYSAQPLLVKNAVQNWTALNQFNLNFFRELFLQKEENVQTDCQFFPFRTKFLRLEDILSSKDIEYDKSWYIGWSNCNPKISSTLRKYYQRPSFFPNNSESSVIDWIFMGYSGQGSSIHLDYVHRPSWQAQISGNKKWTLFPTPECEVECNSFNVTVNKGDLFLIDTNQWYHKTFIEGNQLSITIGSEYD